MEVINILANYKIESIGYNASMHQRPSHLITTNSKNMFTSHVDRLISEGLGNENESIIAPLVYFGFMYNTSPQVVFNFK